MLADAAEFTGDAPQFVSLLRKHRWMDGGLLHDWLDYSGLYLTRKYSKGRKERLVEIWAKHGRVYGNVAPEQLPNNFRTTSEQKPNLTNQPDLTNQQTRKKPPLLRCEIPPKLLGDAKLLVARYKLVVTAEHPGTHCAEDAAANAMASHPTRSMADWMRAIDGYGAHMDRNDCPKSKRQSAKRFFDDRTWADYIDGGTGGEGSPGKAMTDAEIVEQVARKNAETAKKARAE